MSGVKNFGNYVAAIFKLRRTEGLAKGAARTVQNHAHRMDHMDGRMDHMDGRMDHTDGRMDRVEDLQAAHENLRAAHARRLSSGVKQMVVGETQALVARNAELARNYMDLSRRLDQILLTLQGGTPKAKEPREVPSDADGFGSVMDSFYHKLENKYRGTTADIRNRLRIYLPDVESAALRTGGKPVMDIGCGRGEWLGLLADADIPAIGIDTNPVQIADVQAAGLDARHGDARSALSEAKDGSLSCITAHHLIEHLPFEDVLWITREALRVLAPGGLLLFETPNVRNVLVGATSFHNDPTHLSPMTEPVMEVLFETVGFHPIQARPLHPHERLAEFMAKPGFDPELANLLFGAQDLAILGHKPMKGP